MLTCARAKVQHTGTLQLLGAVLHNVLAEAHACTPDECASTLNVFLLNHFVQVQARQANLLSDLRGKE
jgi:hypothetical protein